MEKQAYKHECKLQLKNKPRQPWLSM